MILKKNKTLGHNSSSTINSSSYKVFFQLGRNRHYANSSAKSRRYSYLDISIFKSPQSPFSLNLNKLYTKVCLKSWTFYYVQVCVHRRKLGPFHNIYLYCIAFCLSFKLLWNIEVHMKNELKTDKRNVARRKRIQSFKIFKDKIKALEVELKRVKLQRQYWIDRYSHFED